MKLINNLKITFKITAGYVIMLIMIGYISFSAYRGLSQINSYLKDLYSNHLLGIDYLVEADRDLQQLLVAERSLIFSKNDPELKKGFIAAYNENMEQSETRFNKYKALNKIGNENNIVAEYEKKRTEWQESTREVIKNILSDRQEDNARAMNLSLDKAKIKFEEMRDQLNSLEEINLETAEKKIIEGEAIYNKNLVILISSISAAIILAFVLGFIIIKSIKSRINSINSIVKDLSEGEGDLTVRISNIGMDEFKSLGNYLNIFLTYLEKLIISTKNASLRVETISEEVSTGNMQLSSSTQQIVSNIEEINANVEEIVSSIKNTANGAALMTKKIMSIADNAEASSKMISGMSEAMNNLEEAGKKIGTIVDVVNQIAFQTNLLSLNAAVEAAHAGTKGKGFAVVAREVRALAVRSTEAVKEIRELVTQNSTYIANMIEHSHNSFQTLLSVVAAILETKEEIKEIESMTFEQSTGIEQINLAISQIDHGVQENAAHVEELSTTSETMISVANELTDYVKKFKVSDTI